MIAGARVRLGSWGIASDVYHYDGNTWTPAAVSTFLPLGITGSAPGDFFVVAMKGSLRWAGK